MTLARPSRDVLMVVMLSVACLPTPGLGEWKLQGCTLVWQGAAGGTERRCYHASHLRGATVLSECPGAERDGALCYPPCREGFTGAGPVCWQRCTQGYGDDGATCRRDASIIGANNDACPLYDKCGLTLDKGCSKCPEGYRNDGCTCRIDAHIYGKETYTRGAGSPMSCPSDRQQIGALCYGACPNGYRPAGIMCEETAETCEDVQVAAPATPLQPFCFKMENPESTVTPCFTTLEQADTAENAKVLVECKNGTYKATQIGCEDFQGGRGCP